VSAAQDVTRGRANTLRLAMAGRMGDAALSDHDPDRLRDNLRAALPAAGDGSVTYGSRATAFKARKPL